MFPRSYAHSEAPMRRPVPQLLVEDLAATVQAAHAEKGIINVTALSEEVRLRHEKENVALEDIAEMVMLRAQYAGAAMEFYSKDAN